MRRKLAEILRELLAQPAQERTAIVDSLLTSLDREVGTDDEWESEIQRRIAERPAR